MKSRKAKIIITLIVIVVGLSLPTLVLAYSVWHQGVDAYDKEIERWSGFASQTKSDIATAADTWNDLYAYFDFLCMGNDHNNTSTYPYHDEHNQITKIDAGSADAYWAEITVVDKTWLFWPFTWELDEADINMNGNSGVYWNNNPPCWPYIDVQSVILHEFGHFLGLGHSSEEDAVMYYQIDGGEIKRSLDIDDVNGIYAIY
ncbi:MAG TPA: hypothetical protein DD727_00120 [Clostridiales bacterium]|nr:hypothetical protein [Clostridiales bacterium]